VGAVALALATVALYARVAHHAFLFYDDVLYVTQNPVVRAGLTVDGVAWAFRTLHAWNWHPLTWLSHMLDVELFGLAPGAHHLVNVALHAANAAILLVVLARMTGAPWRSALVAALFAVHPLHVESVAWVAERKDVLSTLFGLLALGAYARYARRASPGGYTLVALALTASLLAKPMWVTAPFLLLLLDVWPLGRLRPPGWAGAEGGATIPLRRAVLEKVPLLALSAASCAVTLLAQTKGGATESLDVALGTRLANATVSYARYLGATVWPSPLSPYYPYDGARLPAWEVAAAAAGLVAITALALRRTRTCPALAVGWLWFLGTLVPVIGLVQVGAQGRADRYTYLPSIGLFLAIAWAIPEVAGRRRAAVAAAAAAAVVALSAVAWRQIGFWSDHVTLFQHAVGVTRDNAVAHLVLSQGLAEGGDLRAALVHAREAARLDPRNARARKNLGYVYYRLGLVDESIDELRAAVALAPDYAEAHGNLGIAYGRKGLIREAMEELAAELRLRSAQASR
jgi:tetratricopeptide (TPR) repeat protein